MPAASPSPPGSEPMQRRITNGDGTASAEAVALQASERFVCLWVPLDVHSHSPALKISIFFPKSANISCGDVVRSTMKARPKE